MRKNYNSNHDIVMASSSSVAEGSKQPKDTEQKSPPNYNASRRNAAVVIFYTRNQELTLLANTKVLWP